MKLVTASEMRELDKRTIEEFGTPGEVLMDRAGHGVADVMRRTIEAAGFVAPIVHLIAGRGNNGGDAFVVARLLKTSGITVEVWIAGSANELQGDALKHFSRMTAEDVPYRELPTKDDWDEALYNPIPAEIIVDGVLGTGARGPARGPIAGAIQYIISRSESALVVSIDVPSGLNADTGEPESAGVRADVTVTVGLPKRGLVAPNALEYTGILEVVDIGIPDEYVEDISGDPDTEYISAADLRPMFSRRHRAAHKGQFGRVLAIGGAQGYAGAISMAARAAVRSGAGLVSALVPQSILGVVAGSTLESMVSAADETETGSLSSGLLTSWRRRLDAFDAILVGPGMTRHNETLLIVRELLRDSTVPLVLDADALAVFENQPGWLAKARAPLVITPHPGEMALLFGQTISEVQQHRAGMAIAAAKFTGCTVVLKGAGTVVAQKGRAVAINLTGNPGMATGGMGDVLAGLLAGLLAQGFEPYDAARAAVYIHGRAGDMVAWRKSQAGLAATDLVEEIPYVFRDFSLR